MSLHVNYYCTILRLCSALSFLLPLITLLVRMTKPHERTSPKILVLAPTRELAMQIENQAKQLMKGMWAGQDLQQVHMCMYNVAQCPELESGHHGPSLPSNWYSCSLICVYILCLQCSCSFTKPNWGKGVVT